MADEPEATVPSEALATLPASDVEEVDTEQPVDLEELADAQANGDEEPNPEAEPAVEEIEVEHEGKKYRIPKELEGHLLRQEDYTRKRQADADFRRELDAREQRLTQQAQMDEREMGARVAVKALDAELENYKGVDWTAEFQKNFENATVHKARYDQLREQRGEAVTFLTQRHQERSAEAQRSDAKRIGDTRDWAKKSITGWTLELDSKITDFVTKELPEHLRLTDDFVDRNVNAKLYNLMHLAYIGKQTLAKATAQPRQVKPATTVQPLTTVAARSSAPVRTSLNDLAKGDDMSAFAESFNKRMAARGRR